MQPIQVKSWSDEQGVLTPFRIKSPDWKQEMRVERIVKCSTSKIAGRLVQVFTCENDDRIYEIEYDLTSTRWFLIKW